MQEIAGEAELSTGAHYRYFEGKEELIEALAEESDARRADELCALEPGGGAGALADFVGNMLAGLGTEAAEFSVRLDVRLWTEALDHPEVRAIAGEAFDSVREPLANYVRAEREAGRIREDGDSDAIGRLVISLLTGLELQRALGGDIDPGRLRVGGAYGVAPPRSIGIRPATPTGPSFTGGVPTVHGAPWRLRSDGA